MRKIYFKDADTTDVESLISSLYHDERSDTYAKRTYTTEEFLVYECTASRRSFEDLLCIANTYFSDISEERLMEALINIKLLFYYCGDIGKIVFHRVDSGRSIKSGNFLFFNERTYTSNTYTPSRLEEILNNI